MICRLYRIKLPRLITVIITAIILIHIFSLQKDCPVSYAVSILDGKWKIPIVWTVGKAEVIRFNELKRRITTFI